MGIFQRRKQTDGHRPPVMEHCEPRILYSAELLPYGVATGSETDSSPLLVTANGTTATPTGVAAAEKNQIQARRYELVIVDAATPERDQLVDDLLSNLGEGRDIEVFVLDENRNGVTQISELLNEYQDLDAVHLIAHGSDGKVSIGNSELNFESIRRASSEIQGWASAFGEDADLLVYGCDLAVTGDGQGLVNSLARLTGADVAASTDKTGASSLGGDWELEYHVGEIDTAIALSQSIQADFKSILATFTVTNTNDSGGGSLRDAINQANLAAGADTITFDITGTGVHTISLASLLPEISGQLAIDGYSQTGAAPNTLSAGNDAYLRIRIDGGGTLTGSGLTLAAGSDGSSIRGLMVTRFDGDGIVVNSSNNTVAGNWVGTDGGQSLGNSSTGIAVVDGAGSTVGGTAAADRNIVAGNGGNGIGLYGTSSSVTVQGNWIGLDQSGNGAIANAQSGIAISSGVDGSLIGGTAPGAANVISGNTQNGIYVASNNNNILGNLIGTDPTGNQTIGNGTGGVLVAAGGQGNTIGSPLAPNTITGGLWGVVIDGASTVNNTISANSIYGNQIAGIDFGFDGLTLNDTGDGDTGANQLLNYPVLYNASVSGGDITITGEARPGAIVEFFISDPDQRLNYPDGYGEGEIYIGSGTVSGPISGSVDSSARQFSFTFSGTPAHGGVLITATATDASGNTSEFAENQLVTGPLGVSLAPALVVVGSETRVNATTANDQFGPLAGARNVGVDDQGNVTVTWASDQQDGSQFGVYARRFDSQGNALTGEILVNQTTVGDQDFSTIAVARDGSFVVAWTDFGSTAGDIYFRRFDANGAALGGETLANSVTAGVQSNSSVALDQWGNFVIAWESTNGGNTSIIHRRFDANGNALNGQSTVVSAAGFNMTSPSVARAADGRFAVSWRDSGQDGSGGGVYARIFSAHGGILANNFRLSSTTVGNQDNPELEFLSNGNIAAVWDSGSPDTIITRVFSDNGTALTAETSVNQATGGSRGLTGIAADAQGNYLLTWASDSQDGSSFGTYARRYSTGGVALGNEFLVNTTTTGSQYYAAVASNRFGQFAVVWEGQGSGDAQGIFLQQFAEDRQTSESGDTVVVQVVLNEAPTANVSVALSLDDATEASVAPTSVTFTSANWATPQTVTVSGVDDATGDGNIDVSLLATATSTDPNYSSLQAIPVLLNNLDDELIVTTAADTVDGDVSSIEALNADNGADGVVSLREAITAANNTVGADEISFNIPSPGAHTINVGAGGLPDITDTLILDAQTQPGYGDSPVITLDGTSATGAGAGLALFAGNSTIRGFALINFPDEGIQIQGLTADNNLLENNWIGITSSGAAAGNAGNGILILDAASGNIVRNNVISSNDGNGIELRISGTDNNWVTNNTIGLANDGIAVRANGGHGIYIHGDAANNTIGSNLDGSFDDDEGNLIAGNDNGGIVIGADGGADNSLAMNTVYGNGELAIDIGDDGVTANDLGDSDSGPNDYQNFPVLWVADQNGANLHVRGALNSTASSNFRLEFYTAPFGSEDASGHGELNRYLGFADVTTDASGDAAIDVVLAGAVVSVNDRISATATRNLGGGNYGSTSEVSLNVAAAIDNDIAVAVDDVPNTSEDTPLILDVTANDTDAEGDAVSAVEFTQPANGSVIDNGNGTLTYTPNASFSGSDTFEYIAIDAGAGLQNYWGLDGSAVDAIGGANGTLNGTTTVPGRFGNGLAFNESSDYVQIPGVTYNNEFSLSFDFKLDDLSGSLFQYIYSHGDINGVNSVNIFLNESGHGSDPNVLRTVVRDVNDGLDNTALQVDVSGLIGDSQWHEYTLTVGAGGSQVYIDGVLVNSSGFGTDGVNPTGDAFLGIRQDLDPNRMYGNALDSVRVFDTELSSSAVADLASQVNRATVTMSVSAVNDAPVIAFGQGDQAYVEGGTTIVIDALATLTDVDSVDFDTGHLLVDITANGQSGDRVEIRNQGTGSGQIGTSGSNVLYEGVSIGTFSGSGAPLDVTFNANADQVAVQAVMRNITFQNIDADPSTLDRTVRYRLSDGDGGDSASISKLITVTGDSELVVTTTSQDTDGNTSSIDALLADRGADAAISLREAIQATNNSAGLNQISFNISGAGVHTINVTAAMPVINDTVLIDGWSEPDYAGTPVIEISGGNLGSFRDGLVLGAGSDGSTIRGLIVNRFTGSGIEILGSNNQTIQGNWLGLDSLGTSASANTQHGLHVLNSDGNQIGGSVVAQRNVISGNTEQGVYLNTVTGTTVAGNYIGTDATGTQDVNGAATNGSQGGLVINGGSGNVIGGTDAAARNVISGNNWFGVEVYNAALNNFIQGNYIGTDATGQVALGNAQGGVSFWSVPTANTVGGGDAGAGNVISGNSGNGVQIANGTSNISVQGNIIGLAADGVTALGNASHGVLLYRGGSAVAVSGNVIGTDGDGSNDNAERNIISSNSGGVVLADDEVSGNTVAGNYIGTDISGSLDRGNSGDGVRISGGANTNTIGGNAATDRNIISGNDSTGIQLDGLGTTTNTVLGNYIGTDAAGTSAVGNNNAGIRIDNQASGNLIGGTAATDRNVISGNAGDGFYITDIGTTGNSILGNFIGTNAAGTGALGNTDRGIQIESNASGTQIGGIAPGAGNVIAANSSDGILLSNGVSGSIVEGNFIGTDLTSTANLGNANGVRIADASGNRVGGVAAGAGNIITNSTQDGINLSSASGVDNSFLGNSIYANTSNGIDLNNNGVTANDPDDVDNGANDLQNYPDLDSASSSAGTTTIAGSLDSEPSTSYRVEFFSSPAGDGTGYGEGQVYLGSATVTTDASGDAVFVAVLGSVTVTPGHIITATATEDLGGGNFASTSEFAANVIVTANTPPTVTTSVGVVTYNENDSATVVDAGIQVIDVDDANLTGAVVSISGGFVIGQDTLTFTNQLGITGAWSAATGVLTLNGTTTQANYQTALRSIGYVNGSDAPDPSTRTVSFTVNDGSDDSNVATRDINVVAVNDEPVHTSPAVVTVVEETTTTLAGLSVADVDAGGSNLTTQLQVSAGVLNITLSGAASISAGVNGSADLTILGTTTDINATLASLAYTGNLNVTGVNADTLTITTNDQGNTGTGGALQDIDTVQIDITNAADLTVTAPATAGTNEDTTLVFNGANVVQVSSDAAADSRLQVTLSVDQGVLILNGTTNLTIVGGANGSSAMVIQGLQSDLNIALDGLQFAPTADYNGGATLSVQVSLEADQLGFYTFDGANADDQSAGVAYDGVFNGNATTVNDGVRGEVLSLDGTGDYVEISGLMGEPANVTLAAWINTTSTDVSGAVIVSTGGSPALYLEADGRLTGYYESGGIDNVFTSTESLLGTGWRHAAVTIDTATQELTVYVDGAAIGMTATVGAIDYDNNTDTFIGRNGNVSGTGFDFDGRIDELRIFSRALAANEISGLAADQVSASDTTAITVVAVNDEPVNTVPVSATVTEETATAISGISIADPDDLGANITTRLQVSAGVLNVTLSGSATISAGTNASGDLTIQGNETDLNATLASLTYTGNSNVSGVNADTLTVTTNDQGSTGLGGALQDVDTVQIDITNVNDAPVLDNSGDMVLSTISEDILINTGASVADIIASAGGDRITDTDIGASEGIAITTRNNGRGQWQHSIDGGASWSNVGTVNDASALLLRSTDLVRFNTNGENGTTTTFEFRAWDQTSGVAGTKVDTTSNGGNTPFSTAIESAEITVTDVNDAPVLDNSGSLALSGQVEDASAPSGAVGTVITDLVSIGGNVTDVDASALTGVAITAADTSNGVWWTSIDGGANWNPLGTVSESSARVLNANSTARVYFQPNTDFNGTVTNALTLRAWDRSLGTNGSLQDATISGGTSAFSATVETADITISPVNDAPDVLAPGSAYSINEQLNLPIHGAGFSVTDVDVASGTVTATIAVGEGGLTVVEGSSGATIIGGNGTNSVSVTGTVTQVNNLLTGVGTGAITYVNNSDAPSASTSISVTVNDGGNTGTDPGLSGDATSEQGVASQTINIVAVNDAPVNTVPGTQTVTEETATAISGISIADADDLGANLTTRLQVNNGVLNVSLSGAATVSAGANASGDLTILGTLTDINATLASLTYTGNLNVAGVNADSLTVTTNDQGNTGSGGALQDVDSIQIDITGVDDPPTIGLSTGASVNEGAAVTIINTMLRIDDVDSAAADLAYTVSTAPATGAVRLNGVALTAGQTFTQDDVDNNRVDYLHNDAEVFSDSVQFTYGDATTTGLGPTTFNLTINAVNDNDPTITSDGAGATAALTRPENSTTVTTVVASDVDLPAQTLTYSINGGADFAQFSIVSGTGVLTFDSAPDFESPADVGADNVYDVTVQVSDGQGRTDTQAIAITISEVNEAPGGVSNLGSTNEDESIALTPAFIGFNDPDAGDTLAGVRIESLPTNGTLTLSGGAVSLNQFIAVSDLVAFNLLYTPNADGNGLAFDNYDFRVQDSRGLFAANANTATYNVSAVNDAPVNSVPAAQTVAEETATAITGITIADVDDLGANLTTRLQVSNGVLNVTLSGGATLSAGANATGDLTVLGIEADINATLASLIYTGNADVTGIAADTLTVTTNDQGNTGSGGALQDVDTVQIDIAAVNDAPVNTVPGTQVVAEEVPAAITGISIADIDDLGANLTTRLQVSNGVLNVSLSGAATISAGANASSDLTILGTEADINASLASLTYAGDTDVNGVAADTLTVTTNDLGNTGSGGAMQDVDTVQIDITAVNDAPVNTVPGAQSIAEETATLISGISIADTDDLGANLTTRLQVSNGVLNVTLVGGATVSAGANASGDLTMLGTEADINATLASLTYTGNTNVNGVAADTLTVTTNDLGNTGSGGALQDSDTVQINITAVNDAPVNTVPGTQIVAEEVTTAIAGISINDPDDLGANLTTRLQVSNGVLNVTLAGSATISVGANASDDLTLLGSEADINSTLASLTYTGDTNVNGVAADTLTVTTNDLGNTGSGGAQQDSDTVQIDITAVNDAPVNTVPGTQSVAEETTTAISGISIADDDDLGANLFSHLQVSSGVLNVTLAGSASVSAGANASADLTILGTEVDINATLASLTYTGNTNVNGVAADTLTVTTNDLGNTGSGGAQQDVDTVQIDITAVNDAPVNTVPGTQSVAEETQAAIAGISIADVDDLGANLTTRLQVGNGVLNVTLAGGATVLAGANASGDLTILGTEAGINATLASLTYTGNTNVNGVAADTLTVTTNDLGNTGSGGAQQDSDTVQIDITAVNDAPVNTVPGTQVVAEEVSTAITGVSIADADDLGANLTTRLQVSNGVLNVTLAGGAIVSAGANDTGDLTLLGTEAGINATLASLNYTGNTNVNGVAADTLTVTTNDLGNTGSGGALQDSDTVQIDISAVNDAPVNTVPGTQTVAEEATTAIAGISIVDSDDLGANLTTRLQVSNGVLNVTLAGGATISVGTNASDDLTILGTEVDINATLASLTYTSNTDINGVAADTLTVTTNDQGNTGSGGALQDSDTVQINITAVNDAPVNTVPGTQTVAEETLTAITGISIADVDDLGANLTTRLQVSSGVLNVTLAGAATISAGANASSDLTLLGSEADINTTLASLAYTGNADVTGIAVDTLTVTTNDQGNTGSGGALEDLDTVQINITAVNDAPVNTVPGTQVVAEEVSTAIAGISIADIDDLGANLTTRLQVSNGVLNVTLAGGATVSVGANASGDFTILGTEADINTTLASLTYTGNTNVNGVAADTLTVTTNDLGNTGSGGAQQDVDTVQIDITAVNDAPINTVPGAQSIAEETATLITGISIADVDDLGANLQTRLQVSNGVLNVTLAGSATVSAGANASSDLTMLGTEADINATLASLTYTGDTNVNGVAADTLTVTTNDQGNTGSGGALQDSDTVQINITAVNDAPVNTVPGAQVVAEETVTTIAGISIVDVDDLGGNLTTRLQVSSGVLNVTLAGGTTVTAGANASADLTLLGSEADINATLASLTYTGDTNVNGVAADTLTVTTNDLGNTGSGGAQQDSDTVQIDITAVNDAPVNTVPGTQSVAEETTTAISGVSIADVDDLGANLSARLQVSSGVVSITLAGSATVSAGANASGDVTILGTEADINATLASLTYTGSTNINGVAADSLTVTTNDLGNTGSGGALQDSDTVQIDISAVNDAPINTVPAAQTVIEDTATAIVGISIADIDDLGGNLASRVQVVNGVLNVTLVGSATISAGANASGDLTILGAKTDINATLASLTYTGNTNVNGVAADTLTVTTNDLGNTGAGGPLQDSDTVQINITAVNDAPVNTVPGTQVVAEETSTAIAGVSIADADDLGANLTTRLQVNSGVLNVSLVGGATVSAGANDTGDLTILGTEADINATLASVIYTGDTNVNGIAADTLTVSTNDQGNTGAGGVQQDVDTVQIDIAAANDAPVNTVPGAQTVAEEAVTAITGISIADVDDLGANLTSRLQVSNGVLSVSLGGAASISAGANGSSDLTIVGTEADINATLASLTYTGNTNVNGIAADTLTVTADDQGNTGSGGALQDVDAVQINITAVNDAPVNTVPGTQVAAEEVTTAIIGISIADADDLGANLTTRLQVSNGVLNLTLAGGATVTAGANASGDLTILGTEADINATLASLTYTGNANVNGVAADTLIVTTNDQGNTGSGGALQDSDSVQIDITAVNDAPTNTVPGTQVVAEETETTITGISIADVDDLGANLTARLEVNNGVLNVALVGGATISVGTNASDDLTILGTEADINATLASLTYTGNTDINGVAADTLTVTTNDQGNTGSGGALQDSDTVQIDITAVNDAPVNTVPGTQIAAEETLTTIPGISITDVDGLGANLTTRLQVSNGVLNLTLAGGATVSAGANDTSDLTLLGTEADINATLTSLAYTGNTNVNGVAADTLTVTTNDLGNTGSGGALQDSDTVQIDIVDVNDAPVIISDGGGSLATIVAAENTDTVTVVTATDVDIPVQPLTFDIVGGVDATHFAIDPDGGELRFTQSPNFEMPLDADANGVYEVVVSVSDGTASTTQSISVTVADVNEPPSGILPGQVAASESVDPGSQLTTLTAVDPDTGEVFTFSLVSDDAGLFELNSMSGALGLRAGSSLDFETQARHELTVSVTDSAGQTYEQVIVVIVTDSLSDSDLTPPEFAEPENNPTVVQQPAGLAKPPTAVNIAQEGTRAIDDLPQSAPAQNVVVELAAAFVDAKQTSPEVVDVVLTQERRSITTDPLELVLSFDWLIPNNQASGFNNDFQPLATRQVTVHFDEQKRAAIDEQAPATLFELASDPVRLASTVLSVGAVWWLTRSGGLIATMLMGIPTWRHLDLLPVISRSDEAEDSLDDDSPESARIPEELFTDTVVDAMFDSRTLSRGPK